MIKIKEIIVSTVAPNTKNVLWIDTSGKNATIKFCRNGEWENLHSYAEELDTEEAIQQAIINNAAAIGNLNDDFTDHISDYEELDELVDGIQEEQAAHDGQIVNLQTGKENIETVVNDSPSTITVMDKHAYIVSGAFVMELDIHLDDSFTTNSTARIVFNSGSTATKVDVHDAIKGIDNIPTNSKVEIRLRGGLATVNSWSNT